nr:MAG TPA: zipper dimerization domain transcription factor-like protein [Caudoviricetes sp.]
MELNEEIEDAQLDIQLLNSQIERLQDRVRRLESMVAAMANMLDLILEKEDTE